MSNGERVRPLPWLKTRSELALRSKFYEELIGFARIRSPTGAYDEAYVVTGDTELAKACRFLAIIRRDHGNEAFEMVVSSKNETSSRLTNTNKQKEKHNDQEK